MGYTPVARWRNFKLENLKEMLALYPDLSEKVPREVIVNQIDEKFQGYKATAYQFCCQLGIEERGEFFRTQDYLYTFTDENLKRYLNFWFKMYVCPNPFVNSNEPAISPFLEIANCVLKSPNHTYSLQKFYKDNFGDNAGSSDIFRNAVKDFCKPVLLSTEDNDTLYILEDYIEDLKKIIDKVNATLPMGNNKDEHEFFERFSRNKFIEFYDIPIWNDLSKDDALRADNHTSLEEERISGSSNIIIYGVPGSGKSYTIANEYCKGIPEEQIQRVVFHPDYTYADFVGQILPTVTSSSDGDTSDVRYDFVAGPFTEILEKSYLNPTKQFYLIIEELNRGNAPAIFGEMFQLLDRKLEKRKNDNGLQIGSSEYGVTNKDVAMYIYQDEKRKVYLPSNLGILATMNTSDQNVFTLDTAFQRRWQMRLLENSFDAVKSSLANSVILDTGITWEKFCTSVNELIVTCQSNIASSEDKRLGVYFVNESDLAFKAIPVHHDLLDSELSLKDEYKHLIKKEADFSLTDGEKHRLNAIIEVLKQNRKFPDKVLKYLWDDAFKFNRDEFFRNDITSLEQVISSFIFAIGKDRWKNILSEKALNILEVN